MADSSATRYINPHTMTNLLFTAHVLMYSAQGLGEGRSYSVQPRQLYMDRFLISVLQWGERLLGVEGGTGCLVSCSLKDFSPDSTWTEVLYRNNLIWASI